MATKAHTGGLRDQCEAQKLFADSGICFLFMI